MSECRKDGANQGVRTRNGRVNRSRIETSLYKSHRKIEVEGLKDEKTPVGKIKKIFSIIDNKYWVGGLLKSYKKETLLLSNLILKLLVVKNGKNF